MRPRARWREALGGKRKAQLCPRSEICLNGDGTKCPGVKQKPGPSSVSTYHSRERAACPRGKRSWKRASRARVSRFQSVDSFPPAGYENGTFAFPSILRRELTNRETATRREACLVLSSLASFSRDLLSRLALARSRGTETVTVAGRRALFESKSLDCRREEG